MLVKALTIFAKAMLHGNMNVYLPGSPDVFGMATFADWNIFQMLTIFAFGTLRV